METILAFAIWIIFATLTAVVGRFLAVKWAERKGWSALTMPLSYHVWFIIIYLVIVQVAWIILYAWLVI